MYLHLHLSQIDKKQERTTKERSEKAVHTLNKHCRKKSNIFCELEGKVTVKEITTCRYVPLQHLNSGSTSEWTGPSKNDASAVAGIRQTPVMKKRANCSEAHLPGVSYLHTVTLYYSVGGSHWKLRFIMYRKWAVRPEMSFKHFGWYLSHSSGRLTLTDIEPFALTEYTCSDRYLAR